jgi:O-antigen/teichoic acid export membrane protein
VIRQFFKHGLVYGAANLVSGLGTIALVPIYTRSLAPSEYGVVDYVAVIQILIQICASLEIMQAMALFCAGTERDDERSAYASTGLWFLVASFGVVCVALYVMASLFSIELLGPRQDASLLGLALLSIYVRILFFALQGQLRWQFRADLYSAASVVAALGSVGTVAYLLLGQGAGLPGVFAGLSVGYAAGCAFCLISLRHTYRWFFDRRRFGQMLRFSLPLVVSTLALFFAGYGDRFILKSTLGFHDLGVYGIAGRVAGVITLAINGFQLGAAPLIYRHHGQPSAPASLAQLIRLFLIAGLLGVAGLAAFSIELLRLFTTPEYAAAWRIVPVLALAIVLANLYTFTPGLIVRNMTRRFAIINIITAAASLLLIAGLLRVFGVLGAALGVLAGSAVGFALHAASSQRVYKVPIEWSRLGAGIGIAVSTIVVTSILGSSDLISLGARVVVFAATSAALVSVLSTGEERALAHRALASRSFAPLKGI